MSKVTVGSLVACGVVGFCWLNPGETFEGVGSEEHDLGKLWSHGGFLYFCAAGRRMKPASRVQRGKLGPNRARAPADRSSCTSFARASRADDESERRLDSLYRITPEAPALMGPHP